MDTFRRRSRRLARLGTATAALAMSALGAGAQSPVTIDVVFPLTGNAAFLGEGNQKTMRALQKVVNDEGGVGGRPIEFAYRDDQTSPQLAVQLTNAVVAQKPPVLIGSALVAMCNAQVPLVRNGPVTYCTSPAIQPQAGGYMYSGGISTHSLLEANFVYLRSKGWKRIALISSTDATGQDFQNGIAAALKRPENTDMQVVENARFNQSDVSVSAQMERIRASNPDILITWTTGGPIATVFKAIIQAGLTIPVVTTNGNQTFEQMDQYAAFLPKQLLIATPVHLPHVGVTYEPAVEAAQKRFYDAMKSVGAEIDARAGNTWDGASLVVDALRKLGPDATAAKVKDYIDGLTDWAGINGIYDFRKYPNRGIGVENAVVTLWDPASRRWGVVSKPGGEPL